jgi:hypothetical protein
MTDTASSLPTLDQERILAQAHALSFPRYPGSDGDRRAIALVREALERTGLEVTEEPFSYDLRPAWLALRGLLLLCALLLGTAGWSVLPAPLLAASCLILALVTGGTFLAWAPGLERVYRQEGPTHTANVSGRRRVQAPGMTIVLMAHHDSKSQNLTLPWRAGMTLTAVTGGLALVVLLLLRLAADMTEVSPWVGPAAGSLAAGALLVLSTLRSGNRSPGAVDNAGSVAILLELARTLPFQLPEDVELIFLSTGAEEDHMVGAMRWLDRHRETLADRDVLTLNFDGAGNPGRVVLLERYGFGTPFSPRLSGAARRAARELGIPVRGVLMPPAMGIDAIPFHHRGLETLTFSSGSLGRATLAIHSAHDRPEHLDAETLGQTARLAAALIVDLTGSHRAIVG